MVTTEKLNEVYTHLTDVKTFLENAIISAPGEDNLKAFIGNQLAINVQKSKVLQVLDLVHEAIIYFERYWLLPTGELRKFQFWNPAHWKQLKNTMNFYTDLLIKLADLLKASPTIVQ